MASIGRTCTARYGSGAELERGAGGYGPGEFVDEEIKSGYSRNASSCVNERRFQIWSSRVQANRGGTDIRQHEDLGFKNSISI
jgi:hypothetical protein